jgi:mutator protein MutT
MYLEPPHDFTAQMEVSGCYCECGDRVLFLLRSPDKPQGNTWCVPGGKLERGETPSQAVVREVREETGIELDEKTLIYCHKVYIRFPEKDLNLHLFRSVLREVPGSLEIALEEHTSWCWVTLEEALQMPLIPGGSDCLRIAFAARDR